MTPTPPERTTTARRPAFRFGKCFGGCGLTFGYDDPLVIRTTRRDDNRGNDVVEAFCEPCWAKRHGQNGGRP